MNNLNKFFQDKKVLITGHTGFKGSWLTKILLDWGVNVSGISLKPNTNPNLFGVLKIENKVNNYFCDIRNFKKIKEIFSCEKPEIVFHLAAQPLVRNSYDDPLYTFETNVIGTANVLQVIKEVSGIKSAVIITTDKVYENKEGAGFYRESDKLGGIDPYSSSKAGAELVVNSYLQSFFNPKTYGKNHGTLISSARSGNIIGGGDWQENRIVPDIVKAVFENKERLIIRNPDSIRPWQHILESLEGYMMLAKKHYEGERNFSGAWNFGPDSKGGDVSVEDLVKKSFKILEKGTYVIQKTEGKHETQTLKLNAQKSKIKLKWKPRYDIDESLKSTLDWYRNFYEKKECIEFTEKQINSFFK